MKVFVTWDEVKECEGNDALFQMSDRMSDRMTIDEMMTAYHLTLMMMIASGVQKVIISQLPPFFGIAEKLYFFKAAAQIEEVEVGIPYICN